jgi:hypothetical protein
MQIFLQSVGVLGPGLQGWTSSRPVLAGVDAYRMTPTPKPVPDILPAIERRRSSHAVRLAIAAGQEALEAGSLRGDQVATVFASSDGDGDITHQICEALATPEREVSPTSFHNSVHNAPAGYWSIATGSRLPSTSVCAYDESFAAGLLEAVAHATVEHQPVLLITSDLPFPAPLHALRPVEHSFAAAFLMTPDAGKAPLMRWHIRVETYRTATAGPVGLPDSLFSNPAARCLPLLAILAQRATDTVSLDYAGGRTVAVSCEPCE